METDFRDTNREGLAGDGIDKKLVVESDLVPSKNGSFLFIHSTLLHSTKYERSNSIDSRLWTLACNPSPKLVNVSTGYFLFAILRRVEGFP
jgi:hypothetical protein